MNFIPIPIFFYKNSPPHDQVCVCYRNYKDSKPISEVAMYQLLNTLPFSKTLSIHFNFLLIGSSFLCSHTFRLYLPTRYKNSILFLAKNLSFSKIQSCIQLLRDKNSLQLHFLSKVFDCKIF